MENINIKQKGLVLILGPMYSGKTTELLRLVRTYNIAKKKTIVIRRPNLNRDNIDTPGVVAARETGISMNCIEMDDLYENMNDCSYDVYAIDEGQFQNNLALFCRKVIFEWGKLVIVAMLNGTFEQLPFFTLSGKSNLDYLIPLVTKIIYLEAICMECESSMANYTYRMTNNKEVEIVGDKGVYKSLCVNCLIKCKRKLH